MNVLRTLITMFRGSRQAEAGAGDLSSVETGHGPARFDAMWDEALMNSMHCETARMFFDGMGPRWK
jgi:hypothetical protein